MQLTTFDHRRDSAGLRYIYPVFSRRSGGISIGVNLNPNAACNWRCIYCQVPELRRGAAPAIDLPLLERELDGLLEAVLDGRFFEDFEVEPSARRIRDIAISGNGEPTSCRDLESVVALIGAAVDRFDLVDRLQLVMISNGSLIQRPMVQSALTAWSKLGGELWFKLDRATAEGIRRINDVQLRPETHLARLRRSVALCRTWIQTCLFAIDGLPPAGEEIAAYLEFLEALRTEPVPIQGVLLYGLARPSRQPEGPRLSALPAAWLEELGAKIEAIGWNVRVYP